VHHWPEIKLDDELEDALDEEPEEEPDDELDELEELDGPGAGTRP
jgi:hypothetical protein